MKKLLRRKALLPGAALCFAASALTCSHAGSYHRAHPVRLKEPPICSECHPSGWHGAIDHTENFVTEHDLPIKDLEHACVSCHKLSYCARCHHDAEKSGDS